MIVYPPVDKPEIVASRASTGVFVVDYNSEALTLQLLASMRAEHPAFVWIVMNGGHQVSAENVRRLSLPFEVELQVSAENLGFGGGVNLGIQTARKTREFDQILLLNPDTTVTSGFLADLESAYGDGWRGLRTPLILTGGGDPFVWYAGGRIDHDRGEVYHEYFGSQVNEVPRREFDTDFSSGACQMIDVQSWDVIGGYREDLFLYWEDVDFSIRCKRAGIPMRVVPSAQIAHDEGATSRTGATKSILYYFWTSRNRLRVIAGVQDHISARFIVRSVMRTCAPLRESFSFHSLPKVVAAVKGTATGWRDVRRARARRHSNGVLTDRASLMTDNS